LDARHGLVCGWQFALGNNKDFESASQMSLNMGKAHLSAKKLCEAASNQTALVRRRIIIATKG